MIGSMATALGEFEQLVLFAVLRLGDDAYGVSIRREIEGRTGRSLSAGAVYTALGRLESRRLVTSRLMPGDAARRGQRRKCYRVTPVGARALHRSYDRVRTMAAGQTAALERAMRRKAPA